MLSKTLAKTPDEQGKDDPTIRNPAYRFISGSNYKHAKKLRGYAQDLLRWDIDDQEIALLSASLLVCPGKSTLWNIEFWMFYFFLF